MPRSGLERLSRMSLTSVSTRKVSPTNTGFGKRTPSQPRFAIVVPIVVSATETPTITLVTCHPFYYIGDAPRRFIVHARRVMFEPWEALTPAGETVPSIAAAFAN